MKLVVRTQQGENLLLDILPNDTFYNVQDRLFRNGKIVLDLSKLASPNKPFSLSANVMEYFGFSNNPGVDLSILSENHHNLRREVEQTQDIEKPQIPESIDSVILENNKERKWSELQLGLNNKDELDSKEINLKYQYPEEKDNTKISDLDLANLLISGSETLNAGGCSEKLPLCRLCAQEIYDEDVAYIYGNTSEDGTTLADKINACLPVIVSQEDKLPKQICTDCLVNLESSYIFSCCVTSAEERLNSLDLISTAESADCPLCCDGSMDTVSADYYPSDESASQLVDNHEEATEDNAGQPPTPAVHVKSYTTKKRGRPKKYENTSSFGKDDRDWCLEEENEPLEKKSRISKRGRPKGSKNIGPKPKTMKNMECFICHSNLKEYNEALNHALSAHCDSGNETYPCPLCQTTVTSEQQLVNHIDTHSYKREVLIFNCCFCASQYEHTKLLQKHVLEKHLQSPLECFTCHVCNVQLLDWEQLQTHVLNLHVENTDSALTCPVCGLDFVFQEEVVQHIKESHVEYPACAECGATVESRTGYLTHIVEHHCTTTTYKLPAYYNCASCGSNFKSQYHLIKHTCSVSAAPTKHTT